MAGLLLQDIIDKAASHRDLRDNLSLLESTKTPIISSLLPRDEQTNANMLMEWPADKLNAPRDMAAVEKDFTTFGQQFQNYGLLTNRVQYNANTPVLLGHMAVDNQNLAGIKQKVAAAITRDLAEHKISLEVWALSTQVAAVGDGTDPNPDKSHAIGSFISSSAQSVYPVPAAHRTPSASIYASTLTLLTERGATSSVEAVTGSIFDVTRTTNTRTVPLGKRLKAWFTDRCFTVPGVTTTAAIRRGEESRTLDINVTTYSNDTGTLELMLTPYINWAYTDGVAASQATSPLTGYILDLSMWGLTMLQAPKARRLPDLGAGERFVTESKIGLVAKAPRGDGAFRVTQE